jgi:hypothetical protein
MIRIEAVGEDGAAAHHRCAAPMAEAGASVRNRSIKPQSRYRTATAAEP